MFLGTDLENGFVFLVKSYLLINIIKQLISIEVSKEEAGIIITLVELNAFERRIDEDTLFNQYNDNCKDSELTLISLKDFATSCNNLVKLKCIKLESGYFTLVEKVKIL